MRYPAPGHGHCRHTHAPVRPFPLLSVLPIGLKHDANSEQLKSALEEARAAAAAPRRPGSIFSSPELLMKLAMDPRGKALLGQPDFMAMLGDIQNDPSRINMYLKDPRMQLVGATVCVCVCACMCVYVCMQCGVEACIGGMNWARCFRGDASGPVRLLNWLLGVCAWHIKGFWISVTAGRRACVWVLRACWSPCTALVKLTAHCCPLPRTATGAGAGSGRKVRGARRRRGRGAGQRHRESDTVTVGPETAPRRGHQSSRTSTRSPPSTVYH